MSELMRELEADLKQERLDQIWKKTVRFLLAVSAAIVVATIGYEVLKWRHDSVAKERTDILLLGAEQAKAGNHKEAAQTFGKLADTASEYYGVAMLKKAQSQVALGDKPGAIATYKELAKKDDLYGQLAKMYAAADGEPVKAPEDSSAPFYHSLQELKAWQLLDKGQKDEAAAIFQKLYEDTTAPASMHGRMREALQQIAPEKLQ